MKMTVLFTDVYDGTEYPRTETIDVADPPGPTTTSTTGPTTRSTRTPAPRTSPTTSPATSRKSPSAHSDRTWWAENSLGEFSRARHRQAQLRHPADAQAHPIRAVPNTFRPRILRTAPARRDLLRGRPRQRTSMCTTAVPHLAGPRPVRRDRHRRGRRRMGPHLGGQPVNSHRRQPAMTHLTQRRRDS